MVLLLVVDGTASTWLWFYYHYNYRCIRGHGFIVDKYVSKVIESDTCHVNNKAVTPEKSLSIWETFEHEFVRGQVFTGCPRMSESKISHPSVKLNQSV